MEIGKCFGLRHTVTAADVTATEIVIPTPGIQIRGAIVEVRTSAGVVKAWNGALTVADESVTIDNAGATDWAATDTIDVILF